MFLYEAMYILFLFSPRAAFMVEDVVAVVFAFARRPLQWCLQETCPRWLVFPAH